MIKKTLYLFGIITKNEQKYQKKYLKQRKLSDF